MLLWKHQKKNDSSNLYLGPTKNLGKITGKLLCRSFFFNETIGNFIKEKTPAYLNFPKFLKISFP